MNTVKKLLIPGLATLGVLAGATGATFLSSAANAESGNTSTTQATTSTTSTASTQNTAQDKPTGPHQYNGKTETALTGTDLDKATAAAKAKVSGGTVVRAETDVDGDGTYEVHMQTADGKMTTVFLDSNFAVTSQTDGMSAKNPGPANGQGGPRDQKSSNTSSSTATQN